MIGRHDHPVLSPEQACRHLKTKISELQWLLWPTLVDKHRRVKDHQRGSYTTFICPGRAKRNIIYRLGCDHIYCHAHKPACRHTRKPACRHICMQACVQVQSRSQGPSQRLHADKVGKGCVTKCYLQSKLDDDVRVVPSDTIGS